MHGQDGAGGSMGGWKGEIRGVEQTNRACPCLDRNVEAEPVPDTGKPDRTDRRRFPFEIRGGGIRNGFVGKASGKEAIIGGAILISQSGDQLAGVASNTAALREG